MLRRTLVFGKSKIHGAVTVHWRTHQQSSVDRGMKAPLLTERPYPLSEVVRRMVRIRCKFEDSTDFSERALLRGEYKFYTGKTCDLRSADSADLVAVVECASFFGFWDNKLLRLTEDLLIDRVASLEPLELMLLFKALPKLNLTASDLYRDVCDRIILIANHGALSFDEVLVIVGAAVRTTPPRVLRHLFAHHVLPRIEAIDAQDHAVAVLRGLAFIDPSDEPALEKACRDAARAIYNQLVGVVSQLSAGEIAEAAHYLALLGIVDSPATSRSFSSSFLERLREADVSALVTMIEVMTPLDHTFVTSASERVMEVDEMMTPAEHAKCLEAAVQSLQGYGVARRAPAQAVSLLTHLLEHHARVMSNTAHPYETAATMQSLEVLAALPDEWRHFPGYSAAVRQCIAAIAAHTARLSLTDCVRALQCAVRIGPSFGEAVLHAVLNQLCATAERSSLDRVGDALRQVRALPPLPSKLAQTKVLLEVLPKLLKQVDGV
jgi:hypothetical protein